MCYYKDNVVVHSGILEVESLQDFKELLDNEYDSFGYIINRNKVHIVVYKTSNKHFAVIYPSLESVCADRHICCINLKTSNVTFLPGVDKHEIHIYSNNDYDNYELVFRIDAKDNNSFNLWSSALKSEDEETLTPFGSKRVARRRSVSRQTSLENIDEDEEYR